MTWIVIVFLIKVFGLPSRELTYIPPGGKENHRLKSAFGMGYVSSLEGISFRCPGVVIFVRHPVMLMEYCSCAIFLDVWSQQLLRLYCKLLDTSTCQHSSDSVNETLSRERIKGVDRCELDFGWWPTFLKRVSAIGWLTLWGSINQQFHDHESLNHPPMPPPRK